MPVTRIASAKLSAAISVRGAELVALETADGTPLLWNGDSAWWTGRAPLLFPIVGRVPDDQILVEGRRYPLNQHGFARTSDFTCIAATADTCSFRLTASPQSQAAYPFAFVITAHYAISDDTLVTRIEVTNAESQRAMPFSFGFHPALLWPLPPDARRDGHDLIFAHAETAPIGRPVDGLLGAVRQPNPVGANRILPLTDGLFEGGALIFDRLASTAIDYRNASGSIVGISFENLPHLGIWTKPGAPFICIEPWHGFAAPEGFSGELSQKPGIILLPPGRTEAFAMRISVAI